MSDLISRQAAIAHLKQRLYETQLNNDTDHPYYEEIADNRIDVWMEEVPSAQKRGKWIVHNHLVGNELLDENEVFICSACLAQRTKRKYNFCPNCGARMDIKEE